MGITQVAFDIPPAIQRGLDGGSLIRYGGVVRDQAGHIVKHLKEVPVVENNEGIIKSIGKNLNKKHLIIGAVLAVMVGGIVYYIHKDKDGKEIKIPKCVADFNNALMGYVVAIRKGEVKESDIDAVLFSLKEIKYNSLHIKSDGDFSFENAELFIDMIREYTIKLAEANEYILPNDLSLETDNIVKLETYLNIQKEVFRQSA